MTVDHAQDEKTASGQQQQTQIEKNESALTPIADARADMDFRRSAPISDMTHCAADARWCPRFQTRALRPYARFDTYCRARPTEFVSPFADTRKSWLLLP